MVFEFRRMWMFDMSMRITLGNLFHECATRYGDRLAVTIAPSGVQVSYAELETNINQFAHGFRSQFSDQRNYVGIMLENSIEYLVASYALKKLNRV